MQDPLTLVVLSSSARLFLSVNNLRGPIPTEVGGLKLLRLSVFQNSLEGRIPEELWQVTTLRRIDLSNNTFVGTISNGVGNLRALQKLNLQKNQFTGSIPLFLGLLTNLGTWRQRRDFGREQLHNACSLLAKTDTDSTVNTCSGDFFVQEPGHWVHKGFLF